MNQAQKYTYTPTQFGYFGNYGIDSFHSWLMEHPKCAQFSDEVWNILSRGLRFAESAHEKDMRRNDGRPYIVHPIEMIIGYLEKYNSQSIRPEDVLTLALHDVIEDHPECWREILQKFGLHVFRDVLILSTGGIPLDIRREILGYFLEEHSDLILFSGKESELSMLDYRKRLILLDIVRITNPTDPFFKIQNESSYTSGSPEFQKIKNAIELYKREIIIGKNKIPENTIYRDDEYLGLGNYLYFTQVDARRKLQDMLHNMGDMEAMEKKKPGYIATRRIKAYILGVKLKNFGMHDAYAELQEGFQKVDMQMLTDAEVLRKIID